MKAKMLKIAGVKSEKEFYEKYPTEEAFMKVHGKAFKKAQMGATMQDKGQLKKLDQLTDFGGIPTAQEGISGVDKRNVKAASTEFGTDRKCRITSANDREYKACQKAERKEDKIIQKQSKIEEEETARQKAQEWADYINPGLDPYGEKYGKKDKTFMENYNRFISTNPQFVQEQSSLGISPEQRYAMIYKMAGRSASPTFAAAQRLRGYMGLKPTDKFTDQQMYEAAQKMGGIDKYAEWWKSGYPEIKQQKRGGKLPKYQFGGSNLGLTQSSLGSIPNMSDPLLWGTPGTIQGTAAQQPMLNPNPAPIMMDQNQTGTFQQQVAGSAGATNPNNLLGKLGGMSGVAQLAGNVINSIRDIKQAKENKERARMFRDISGLTLKAASTLPEQVKRKYVRSEDMAFQPEQRYPTYGTGTNFLQAQDGGEIVNQIGGNPTEIQNMYNPGTLYDDLGYEPLGESEMMKQYQLGGFIPDSGYKALVNRTSNPSDLDSGYRALVNKAQGGINLTGAGNIASALGPLPEGIGSLIGGGGFTQSGASQLGSTIGGTVGSLIPIPGAGPILGAVGGIIGGIAGGQTAKKTRKYQEEAEKNLQTAALMSGGKNIQNQYSSFVRDGGLVPYAENGWISHDWQPQVITHFGEHSMNDLLKRDPMMDTLRTGGNIRQNYRFPTDQFAMGGDLQTHWGGKAEPMSYNPYLPEGGETVMFRGQSHEESDGKGRTGIGVTYGDNPVEVERGEPAVKLKDGSSGDSSLVVFGNLKVPNHLLHEIGDPNAKGKKFKTYTAELSKKENRQNKIIEKATDIVNDADDRTPFGKLAVSTAKAMMQGAHAKLQQYAEYKQNAAAVQSAINESAEEHGLVADDLAKGKITMDKSKQNQAKWGAKMETAQTGGERKFGYSDVLGFNPFMSPEENAEEQKAVLNSKIEGLLDLLEKKGYDHKVSSGVRPGAKTKSGKPSRHATGEAADVVFPKLGSKAYQAIVEDRDIAKYMMENGLTAINEYDPSTKSLTGAKGDHIHFGFDKGTTTSDQFRQDVAKRYSTKVFLPEGEVYGELAKPKTLQDVQIQSVRQKPITTGIDDETTPITTRARLSDLGVSSGSAPSEFTPITSSVQGRPADTSAIPTKKRGKFDWSLLASQLIPYLRPSDAEPLDPRQLYGEMFSLATNQLEPVQAQLYQPLLQQAYDISLQDQLNEITAQTRATERLAQGNPAALANIAAQANQAKSRVLAEQFRTNQALKAGVYNANRQELNQAYMKNLDILDRQYTRQAQAKTTTKETARAALESIASKLAQNKLENRTLQTYENLYNYRFDPKFRAINYNAPYFFNTDSSSRTTTQQTTTGKNGAKMKRNSNIVKAMKGL